MVFGRKFIMVGFLAPYLAKKLEVDPLVYFLQIMRKNTIRVDSIYFSQYPTPYEYHKKFVKDWRTRLFFESWKNPYIFFTLTYDEDSLPLGQVPDKDGIQRFFKRFRRRLDYRGIVAPFRYYLVSEYGDNNGRLHYHGIMFGIPFSHEVFKCFLDSWQLGRVDYKAGHPKDINYVTKYLHKRFYDKEHFISLKSKGLGSRLLSPSFLKRQRERKQNWIWFNGRKYILPRYMMTKIFDDDERKDIYMNNKKERLARCFRQSAKYPIGTFAYSKDEVIRKDIVNADDKYKHALAYFAYQRQLDVERYRKLRC